MRINLFKGGKRPLFARLGLEFFRLRTGVVLGPVATLTYRPDLLGKEIRNYSLNAMHGSGGWSKGEAELFAAFVSRLNSCSF